ncbi:MAG: DUF4440 domain-containing protein [Neisseria sp.]|uniref:nuclear transport factor 2 family protein n=1 Tax=Neisseria sp. TaxID=192066 RepID=UPI0026DB1479|nr:DUF4440 domain-containing protein [Neisseria sp.]MDO4249118.1 DUF4440 domain-containing protein [Neisseria sp.]
MNDLLNHLILLEAELHHHGILCSPDRLPELLHPHFHEVGQSGSPYARETVAAYLAGCSEAPPARGILHTMHTIGPDQALLTYLSALASPSGETAYTWRSSLWLREKGQWQLFYHQGTPASAASIDALREQGKL